MNSFIRKEILTAKQHLQSVNMNYREHFLHSSGYSLTFFNASAKAFIHALFPSAFITTSSDLTKKLNSIEMKTKYER